VKHEIPMSKSYRLLYPRPVVLVSCMDTETGKPNLITIAWAVPLSISPPTVGILVAPKRYSHELIEKSREFTINVPTMAILEKVVKCGKVSGRTHDKFAEFGLTPIPGRKVSAPAVKECVAHIECRLANSIKVGDHTLFVGEVLAAYSDEHAFDGDFIDVKNVKQIFQIGGNLFTTTDESCEKVE
jgi:flavin reductase (DIM6/NTAB) family NADH-FMN oxidoreductase RutF